MKGFDSYISFYAPSAVEKRNVTAKLNEIGVTVYNGDLSRISYETNAKLITIDTERRKWFFSYGTEKSNNVNSSAHFFSLARRIVSQ